VLIAVGGVDYTIPTGGKSTSFVMQDMFLIIAAALALAVLLGFGVYFWNKNRRHHHHHHHGSTKRYSTPPAKPPPEDEDEEDTEPEEGKSRHRRRRRKHNHRPRNPTLAETGGLPPLRQGDPTKPPL
jgi:hypothetical protein